MFSPAILAAYTYRRTQVQLNPIDSCTDTAEHFGTPANALAAFLVACGIDAPRLSLI
jgi:hypothetical protein